MPLFSRYRPDTLPRHNKIEGAISLIQNALRFSVVFGVPCMDLHFLRLSVDFSRFGRISMGFLPRFDIEIGVG